MCVHGQRWKKNGNEYGVLFHGVAQISLYAYTSERPPKICPRKAAHGDCKMRCLYVRSDDAVSGVITDLLVKAGGDG